MIAVVQRVSQAKISIEKKQHASIGSGMLVLLGIKDNDQETDADYLVRKISNLRIFNDENQKMNLNINQVNAEILLVSQFTLLANTKNGNRPSYMDAAKPEEAIPLYEYFIFELNKVLHKDIKTGVFGADMQVSLCNDGPVSIILNSEQ